MNAAPPLRRNVIVNVGGGSVSMLGQIVLFPLAVACAGIRDYGVWLSIFGLITFLTQLDGGLGTALIRQSAQARAAKDSVALGRLAGGTRVAYLGLALAMCAAALPIVLRIGSTTTPSSSSPSQLAAVAGLALLIAVATRRAQALTMGAQRFDVERLHQFAGLLVRALGLAMTFWLGWGLTGVAASESLSLVIPGLLSAIRLRTVAPDIVAEYGREAIRHVVSVLPFTARAGMLAALQTAAIQLPVTLVGLVGGPSLATLYAAPQRAQQAVRQVLTWATYPLLPAWATASGSPGATDRPTRSTPAAFPFGFFAAAAVAPLLVFGHEILDVWVGPDFLRARWLLAALALCVLVQGLHALGLIMSLARGGGGTLVFPSAVSAAAILIGVVFAAEYSLSAIAVTTLAATLLTEPLFIRALSKADDRDTRSTVLAYAAGSAGPLAAAGIARLVTFPISVPGHRLAAGVAVFGLLLAVAAVFQRHRFSLAQR